MRLWPKCCPIIHAAASPAGLKRARCQVNGRAAQPKDKLVGAERIEVAVPQSEEVLAFTPEPMDLDIIYEDDSVMVLSKPAGMVVHPAAGNWSGTLLNGLLAHNPALAQIPRWHWPAPAR